MPFVPIKSPEQPFEGHRSGMACLASHNYFCGPGEAPGLTRAESDDALFDRLVGFLEAVELTRDLLRGHLISPMI
jgi:hypothetical protein